ncbi:MAG: hypothetical protein KJO31_12055, partial [Gammaproteobacteria bacterium]|nr:hypothetical protein [Gammaproteobacteria bacterium]
MSSMVGRTNGVAGPDARSPRADAGAELRPSKAAAARRTSSAPDATRLYLNEIGVAKLLTAAEEVKFARRIRDGDE